MVKHHIPYAYVDIAVAVAVAVAVAADSSTTQIPKVEIVSQHGTVLELLFPSIHSHHLSLLDGILIVGEVSRVDRYKCHCCSLVSLEFCGFVVGFGYGVCRCDFDFDCDYGEG